MAVSAKNLQGPPFTGAVIEVGTNSTKLLVASFDKEGRMKTHTYQRKITRLGEGVKNGGSLKDEAIWRTAGAVKAYRDLAVEKGAQQIAAVGTHVLRVADNALDFLEKVRQQTGLEVEVLTGDQEAMASRDGALFGITDINSRNTVILDIGGGSTEVVRGIWSRSIPLGAVSLTESVLEDDPPLKTQLVKGSTRFRDLLLGEVTFLVPGDRVHLIGVGGTVTAVACLCRNLAAYEPEKIEGFSIDEKKLLQILESLSMADLNKRRKMMPFDPDRADIIIAGLLIMKVFFRYFHVESFTVSIKNIIHGIFIRKFGGGPGARID